VVVSAPRGCDEPTAPRGRIRAYLAHDHPLFLEGMARAVRGHGALELAGTARNGVDALEGLRRERPDVAVVDLRMPGLDGATLVARSAEQGLETRIVVLSDHLADHLVYDTLALGAGGYLTKDMGREDILEAVLTAAAGHVVIAPAAQSALAREIRRRERATRPRLSARELEVLALAAEGKSTPEIADALNVGTATVKSHLQKSFDKLAVTDRTSAVVAALRRGLLR
jgi:two-component system, NarL family, nitrate/nitrite response regulator NarL